MQAILNGTKLKNVCRTSDAKSSKQIPRLRTKKTINLEFYQVLSGSRTEIRSTLT